jgi:signal transduction histidine kinase
MLTASLLAIVAVSDVATLGAHLESLHEEAFIPYEQAGEMENALHRTEVALLTEMETSAPRRQAQRAVIDRERQLLVALLERYTTTLTLATQPRMRALVEEYGTHAGQMTREQHSLRVLHAELPRLHALVDTVWNQMGRGPEGAARAIYEERAAPLLDSLIDATSVLMAVQLEQSAYASRAGRAAVQRTERAVGLTIELAFVLALAAIIWLTRSITRPLLALMVGTRAVGRGDLSQPVRVTSRDEIGLLAAAFNQMIAQLGQSQRDVTAARDDATRASHAKSDFLAHMSHELRTPLGSIIGFTNVMRKNKRGNLLPADLQYLDRMHTSGKHLLGLINEILDLAKLESGKFDMHPAPTDIGQLLVDVAQLLEGQVITTPVTLVVAVPAEAVVLEVDAENLKRVLINLAGNALKFTDTGSVTLRLTEAAHERRARIEVVDTGMGIPADRLDGIFEPFEQEGATTTRTHGGTGLGLSISRALCAAMGCSLSVESTVGAGSTFRVLLPAAGPMVRELSLSA